MSKYRFKTKEEFIRDELWDKENNCPNDWSLTGEMNKYLGIDVPDKCIVYCDKKEDFEYDGWYFKSNEYVLKEQQEYFDDLSQHIGRYIRALIDSPHSGIFVKKGDVGKIINREQADFPNNKGYYCTEALSEDYLGTKYELLPEDYSPEQGIKESDIEFIPGKWYKWYQKNHGSYHYGKVNSIYINTDTLVVSPWIIQCDEYKYSGSFDLSKAEQIQEISVEEVQEFLPKNHSDKIQSNEFKKGEYIVITDNYSGGFCTNYIYKQRKDYEYLEAELDNNGSTINGFARYEKKNSHNWRYATQEEIDEYERRGKPYNVIELNKQSLPEENITEIPEFVEQDFDIYGPTPDIN